MDVDFLCRDWVWGMGCTTGGGYTLFQGEFNGEGEYFLKWEWWSVIYSQLWERRFVFSVS